VTLTAVDLQHCLSRIAYNGPLVPDLSTLTALQQAFLYRVPFESLDIHLGHPITLDTECFYTKIVEQHRGGFCYECNALFHAMLQALGYEVYLLGAAMLVNNAVPVECGHMALLVRLEQDYLVDVGNGQSCRRPLRLDGGNQEVSEGISYRVGTHGHGMALYYREAGSDWEPRFRFSTRPLDLREFAEPCRWQQTSPESRFTRHRLASVATPQGRVTLLDGELTITGGKNVEVRQLSGVEEYGDALQKYFGLVLQPEELQVLYTSQDGKFSYNRAGRLYRPV
jgi:N-hydroxyarylamine O-acetyltransferase